MLQIVNDLQYNAGSDVDLKIHRLVSVTYLQKEQKHFECRKDLCEFPKHLRNNGSYIENKQIVTNCGASLIMQTYTRIIIFRINNLTRICIWFDENR